MSNKAIIYARVSSDRQKEEGFSIPAQLKFLKDYAERNNLTIVKEFQEAETAKKAGREEFEKMLSFFEDNKDVRVLLVEKTDRLYRNFTDYVSLERFDLTIHLAKEGEVISRDSKSHQKFIHGIKLLMAKNYLDNLSEEVKKGHLEKVEQGGYPHNAPVGYKNNKETHDIDVEPLGKRLVQALFERYATGKYSLDSLRLEVIEEGLTSFYKTKYINKAFVARVLRSPIYLGMIPFRGKLYKGKHEPIISKDLFNIVQDLLDGKGKSKGKSRRRFNYSGLMVCSNCGCSITAEIKKGKYVYYHCTNFKGNCSRQSIREEVLKAKVNDGVKDLRIQEDKFDWIKEALLRTHNEEIGYREQMISEAEKELEQVRKWLDQAYQDRTEGKIPEEFWISRSKRWNERQVELESTIELHRKANKSFIDTGIKLLKLGEILQQEHIKENKEAEKGIVNFILSNSKLNGQNVELSLKKPFSILAEYSVCTDFEKIRGRRDSNSRPHA